jgi:hypothetical protein
MDRHVKKNLAPRYALALVLYVAKTQPLASRLESETCIAFFAILMQLFTEMQDKRSNR